MNLANMSRLGHFVRIAHDEVSVSHPDAIKALLIAPLEKVSRGDAIREAVPAC
jgi:hypothetical protein